MKSIRRLFTQESNIICRSSSKRISNPSFDPLHCAGYLRQTFWTREILRRDKIRWRGTSKCRIAFKKRATGSRTRGSDGLKYQRSPAARLRTIRDSSPRSRIQTWNPLWIFIASADVYLRTLIARDGYRDGLYIYICMYVYISEISRIFNEKFDY